MKFRTEIISSESPFRISHRSRTLFTGSCFTNNIGQRLVDLRFPVIVNPFGVVYNPLSIKRNIDRLLSRKLYTAGELHLANMLWFSWDHHSSFSDTDRDRVLDNINSSLTSASDMLYRADYLLLTFGTAWVYRLKKSGEIVCNCHKVPSREFDRELLTPSAIFNECDSMIGSLKRAVPGLKIVLTISPVRHWKDGPQGNQVSKAALHLAVSQLLEKHRDITGYFPAYELMIDDLRDYRFYADDLVHPNKQAIEYIWEKFSETYFTKETRALNQEIQQLVDASAHRTMFPATDSHRKFLEAQLKKTKDLQKRFPDIDFSPFLSRFENSDN
jgi:hypothetical protein